MGRKRNVVPSYLHHKPSGQAYCRVGGLPVYLGSFNSPESRKEYARVVGTLQPDIPLPARGGVTVSVLVGRFKAHAESYYRDADGKPTSRVEAFKFAVRPLVRLFGGLPVNEFDQVALKAVRQEWIGAGNSRGTVNGRTAMVKQIFAWGAEERLVDALTAADVRSVRQLKRNRSGAKERPKVKPAPEADVAKVLAVLFRPAHRAMFRVQLLTGMRPGEVCRLKPAGIDRTQLPWRAEFGRHKTEHKDKSRVVFFGPQARGVLMPYLERDVSAYCFDPREWAAGAKEPFLSPRAWWRVVKMACERAGVKPFAPNRLRHTKATAVREEYGIEGSQHVLDHAHLSTTEVYAERSEILKRKIAEETG